MNYQQIYPTGPLLKDLRYCKTKRFRKRMVKTEYPKTENLGLTISHTVGYELSPLGQTFILRLRDEE